MTSTYKNYPETFWKNHLDNETFKVRLVKGSEAPGSGHYNKFYQKGTYYCTCCVGGYPLFSSETKFDAGSGWPSLFEAREGSVYLREDPDDKLNMSRYYPRTEVLCNRCMSHLGHVFNDGSPPACKRYCINSVALVFVPEGQKPKRTFEMLI